MIERWRTNKWQFQSTPPMQGATCIHATILRVYIGFQSTPPMQGATVLGFVNPQLSRSFNPRPLCRERHFSLHTFPFFSCFNPRPLCRERQRENGVYTELFLFQSTPPMQGATDFSLLFPWQSVVSIHAPYAGSDGL